MNAQTFQQIRYEAFKTQNPELGDFDVTFEIEGRIIYAHKFMLRPISTTFSSMISERWTSKDVPIPLDTYEYDSFYQFLTFLYSTDCLLTYDNIATMIDIAEFYQVPIFKDYCEEYLLRLKCTLENVITLLEISSKYSLEKLAQSLIPFVSSNFSKILRSVQISKEILFEIIKLVESSVSAEKVFEKVYEWAEKQALSATEINGNLNVDETIKQILVDFMPLFDFGKMEPCFTLKYLVDKSLLPSGPKLGEILLNSYKHSAAERVNVKITDANGRIMKGQFSDPGNVFNTILKLGNLSSMLNFNFIYSYWKTSREGRPSKPILMKRDDVKWYFIYDKDNDFAVKPSAKIIESDYLIAEMFAEENFDTENGCKMEAFCS